MGNLSIKKIDLFMAIAILSIIALPHFFFVVYGNKSLAVALIFTSGLLSMVRIFYIMAFKRVRIESLFLDFKFIIIAIFIIAIFSLYAYFNTYNFKPLISGIALISLVIFGFIFSLRCVGNYKRVASVFPVILLILFLFGWYEILIEFRYLGYENLVKPIFPFSEHSHYALAVGFVGFMVGVTSGYKVRILVSLNYFLQALIFPNLTLLVYAFLSILMFFPINKAFIISIFVLLISITFGIYYISPEAGVIDYYSSRITLNESTKNLTALVYMQGLQDAWSSLVETSGMGLGFQMMGLSGGLGEIGERILLLTGREFNVTDGGFIAAKIVTELGLIGIFVTIFFFYRLGKSFVFIYKININKLNKYTHKDLHVMLHGAVCAFSVEFFLRGFGYFSPQLFILFILILMVRRLNFSQRISV